MSPIYKLLDKARENSRSLLLLTDEKINKVLNQVADRAQERVAEILKANKEDLNRMDPKDPKYDRLLLTEERIASIATDMRHVATLKSPFNEPLGIIKRPNGLVIRKIAVPFGVIGIIYEARPNVSFDVFSLCFKTANVCILKGGSDADCTNQSIVKIIHEVLIENNLDPSICTLLPATREATSELLEAVGLVDLIIPRGSSSLINFVRAHAKVPVIETGAGICHTFFDKTGDLKKGAAIIKNAKTRRVSVCNALDCLLIHRDRLKDLPYLVEDMAQDHVIIYADELAYEQLNEHYPKALLKKADASSFGTEFLDYKMAIKTVDSLEDALKHIQTYSSKHSESIVSESEDSKEKFCKLVDAACVYTNVSTAFTDGGQFGFGAEIGISTQKLHARGPMALREITSYKYIIEGNGQIRQ